MLGCGWWSFFGPIDKQIVHHSTPVSGESIAPRREIDNKSRLAPRMGGFWTPPRADLSDAPRITAAVHHPQRRNQHWQGQPQRCANGATNRHACEIGRVGAPRSRGGTTPPSALNRSRAPKINDRQLFNPMFRVDASFQSGHARRTLPAATCRDPVTFCGRCSLAAFDRSPTPGKRG